MKFRNNFYLILAILLSTVFVSAMEIEVPKGSTVTIDGKINEDEWKDAVSQDLKGSGQVKLKHDGEFLLVGLQGGKAGLSHVYLTDGKEVFVFHASAALGMVTYQKSGEVWNTTQKFKWELRDQSTNNEASSAYLKTNGWLASVSPMTANDRKYKISMKFKGSEDFRLVAVYYNNPTTPQFFPNTIADDTLNARLLFGSEPNNLSFKTEQWATLKLKDK
jgi:hypothetical protein